jgi:hypothetical protein
MQTSNAKQTFRDDDPVWVLLAELSLGAFLSDHDRREEPTAGFLFQTAQELVISPECMENMTRTLAGFAKEALTRYEQWRLEFPGRIRIFCQKKMIDDASSANAYSGAHTIGGWGYFMIERGEDLPPDPSATPHHDIDVYLYKEGE